MNTLMKIEPLRATLVAAAVASLLAACDHQRATRK